jgi:hypothetical protein
MQHLVDLQPAAAELPLEYLGVPITYLSINDFLNLLVQLKTVSELLEYLNAKHALPVAALHTVGDEKPRRRCRLRSRAHSLTRAI